MQKKVFRVERMFADGFARMPFEGGGDPRYDEVIGELKALRSLCERRDGAADPDAARLRHELSAVREVIARSNRELAALQGLGKDDVQIARAVSELAATIDGMEKATQKILKSSEAIDESAKALGAVAKNDYERGLAQDVQDHVVAIYEACNFQDLAGQHIGKAMAALKAVEKSIGRMVDVWDALDPPGDAGKDARRPSGRDLVNGPKLEGDAGHASQIDIDRMFA